jgi:hypothetical protein
MQKLADLANLQQKESLKYGHLLMLQGWGVRCTSAGGPGKMR